MRWPWRRRQPVWPPPEDDTVTLHARRLAQRWQGERERYPTRTPHPGSASGEVTGDESRRSQGPS